MTEESTQEEFAIPAPERMGKPIVLEYKKKKKKKKYRYSRGLRDVQEMEEHFTRINKRVAKAISKGVSTYDRRRSDSAEDRRDGAIRDFIPNMGEALSDSLNEASRVPSDVAKMLNTKTARRMLRQQLRLTSGAMRIWTL